MSLAGTIVGFNEDDTTWGTYQASTAWVPCTEIDFGERHIVTDVPTMGRPGANGLYLESNVVESIEVRPRLAARVGYQSGALGFLLEACFGDSTTSGGSAPYTHTYDLQDAPALGLSISVNRSDATTEKAGGCRVSTFSIVHDKGDSSEPHMVLSAEMIGKSTGGEEAAVSPTYPPTYITQRIRASELTGFTFNSVDRVASGELLRYEVRVDRKMDRAQSLGSKYTQDPVQTAPMEVTVTARFRLSSTTLYAAHRAQTQGDIVITYDGAATHDGATLTARNSVISEYRRTDNAGQNVVEVEVTWKAYADASGSPLTLAITNAAADDRTN